MFVLPGPVVSRSQLTSTALGLEFLGGIKASGGEASIQCSFPLRDTLIAFVGITGLSTAAHVALRCNGDFAANYWFRTFTSSGLAAGLVTFSNNQSASQAHLDLEPGTSISIHRHWFVNISNRLAMPKTAFWQGSLGSATNDPVTSLLGVGEWVNTAAQISTLALLPLSGTLNSGCRLQVFGRDYP